MSITFDNPHYAETKKKLDGIGCGMCLAKWTQVTMHLQMGQTHSCHHPSTHHIPVKEIKRKNVEKRYIFSVKENVDNIVDIINMWRKKGKI